MPRRKKFNSEKFLDHLAMKMAAAGKKRALPYIKSKTLRMHTSTVRRRKSRKLAVWAITIPHYWAVFRNDGTRSAKAKKGRFIALFPNKRDDPRTSGGNDYAKRLVHRRKLKWSKKQIKKAIAKKELVFTKKVDAAPAEKFFDNDGGMQGFSQEASKLAEKEMTKAVKNYLGPDLNLKVSGGVFI